MSTNMDDLIKKKPQKKRRIRLKKVDLDNLNKKLLNVLSREINHLMQLSFNHKLEKDDADALAKYVKLLKELQKDSTESNDNLTDEQLEKLASKS